MKKILKSGNYSFGGCGLPTGLFDTAGEELFTGDVVAIGSKHEWDAKCYFNFAGICVVVSDTEHEGQSDDSCFVMGLKSEHHSFIDGEPTESDNPDADYKFSSVVQNHEEWVLQKVKGWEDVAHTEKNGGITCYLEGLKQNDFTTTI